ncbi:radical SAM protein [Candidatus Oleimmundimicrobium sp.]|uniref:radical SAM protein n=1 Tax=Candidatus Oleimmundimicrobium sp. TaxID=3060597 RepID=UPI0027251465|nr:radical SAM protein [Candidatus Oleimmundimicrobium sp.]MDO8885623.1 radical SAM protein [Candidatus Oleimmundimicrobium sp.]
MNYVYGPVPSRRLGFSLGVDIIPFKICSYDCIYCQLGKTTLKTVERKAYVSSQDVLEELALYSSEFKGQIDYIAFSGSGEPTLNSEIGKMIRGAKNLTSIPVAVLTNGSIFFNKDVREDLMEADVVLPSLDAITSSIFQAVNVPCPSLKIRDIIEGLCSFIREFKGEVWLEVLLCRGINDGEKELERIKEAVELIKPNKVQLNTVVRPSGRGEVYPLNYAELEIAREIIGNNCEIIADFKGMSERLFTKDVREEEVLALLRRRPCTIGDISKVLGVNRLELIKYIEMLNKKGKLKSITKDGKIYYYSKG